MHDRGMLILPDLLVGGYTRMIDRLGLRSLATQRNRNNPPRGGLTLEQTNEHFAQQFDGSAARAQLALLDPLGKFSTTANTLLRKLSGNHLLITDAPCGAGAATLALLSTIAQLRASQMLPREPLDVHIIAAELSGPARDLAQRMYQEISGQLAEQAITVQVEALSWDVTNPMSNTELVRRINVARERCKKHLLIVANFNGFLVSQSKQQSAKQQLNELFRYCSGKNNYAVWIEPSMNNVVRRGGLFGWLWRQVLAIFPESVRPVSESDAPVPTYNTYFRQALDPDHTARLGLALLSLDLSL